MLRTASVWIDRSGWFGSTVRGGGAMSDATAVTEDPELSARDRMRALVRRVAESCDLPTLPAVAARALTLARSPNAKANDLAKLVLTDGPLAARVLKISRSVLYARRYPPSSLKDAIVTVGFGALRKILIAASARSAYRADDAVAQRLWEHALATALAADELAVAAGRPRGGDAFIAGLLHDIGKLVFHLSDPDGYRTVMGQDEAAEEALFGVSHAAVGACLAEQWGLDTEIGEAILLHHSGDSAPLVVRLATADRIAHEIGYASVAQGGAEEGAAAPAAGPADADASHTALLERVTSSFESERSSFE